MNTGEALVSLGARPALGEAMVAGDVVNTASRLQQAAPVNGVIVGGETYASTRDAIHYEPADPVEAKGKATPVEAWIAIEPSVPAGTRRLSGELVGRRPELDMLRGIWERVSSERVPHLVTVLGPAGIGKTRLAQEFERDRRGARRPQRPRPLAAVPGEQRLLRLRDAGQAALRHLRERPAPRSG